MDKPYNVSKDEEHDLFYYLEELLINKQDDYETFENEEIQQKSFPK